MKNYLLKNYNIKINKIIKKNGYDFFFYNNTKIYIKKYYGDIQYLEYLFNLTNYLYRKKIKVNTFIINNKKMFYTKYNDYYVVLLKVNDYEYDVDLNKLFKFKGIKTNLYNYNIYHEWKNEIDNIERELIEYNKEFKIIQESIDYFIGIGENAIELINTYKKAIDQSNDSIGHIVNYKLFYENSVDNPFCFIKVNTMYDIASLIKTMFYKSEIDFELIDNIFNRCNEYERIYLFSCLLYPGEYFDLIKKIFLGEEEEHKIDFYVKSINSYRKLLTYCQNSVKSKSGVTLIDWLSI